MVKSLLFIVFGLFSFASFGQDSIKTVKKKKWEIYFDSLTAAKVGKPFIKDSILKTIENETIFISNLKQKTMVCFGMYGCHPCAHELPAIVSLASKTNDVDFIYITFNDEKTIRKEFEEVLGKNYVFPSNYHIVIMKESEMKNNDVHLGYPTKYYLDKNGIVLYFQYGKVSLKSTKEELFSQNLGIINKFK